MSWLTDQVDEAKKDIERRVKEITAEASEEFFKLEKKKTEDIYRDVIDDFYNSYDRKFYKQDESLYNLLECTTDNKKLILDFHPEKISMRNGYSGENGLYTSVFKEGWHGGSGKNGRKSYPVAIYDGEYKPYDGAVAPYDSYGYKWVPAKRAKISPYDDFVKRWNDFQYGEYEEDFYRIFKKHFDKF